jgi:hypothetical protein
MRLHPFIAIFLALFFASSAAATVVRVDNATYPTRCAEEDNVFLTLGAPNLAGFRVEATHPAYIAEILRDSYDPDFTDCHFGPTPPAEGPFFTPRQFVMWETDEWVMVGNTDRHFWRKVDVPVRWQGREENHVHLIQFYRKRADGRRDQVLVLYPADGHWRLKPLPVPHLDYNVYGASILIGPLEAEDRRKPYVAYTDVAFDAATLTFAVGFVRGGRATIRIDSVTRERTAIEVWIGSGAPTDRPLAAMRSMFVAPDNADVGEAIYVDATGRRRTEVIKDFTSAMVTDILFGRSVVSRHNTSAPDNAFRGFVFR